MFVVPPPVLVETARHILVSGLYPTDIGWFPRARHHARQRAGGAEQNILILCTRGSGWFEINGRRHPLKQNQTLLLPANTPHEYGASQRDPWSIQWVHFLGDDAAYFFTLLKSGSHIVPVAAALTPKLNRLFADAYEALSGGFTQQSIICAAQAVRHMLGLLFFNNRAFHPRTQAESTESLDRATRFMRDRVDSVLTVAEMARQAGLSVTHFTRLMRQHTGFTPIEYFIHLKMQRACRFLMLTALSVKEIAGRIGYDDPYYFSRLFRKVMGMSPVAYRKTKLG
ncbi:MAG: AraC family transcriptional regulator [Verrucomicrobia bacterium]|nr:AraC family transcriptional regulator [Verrucomicrobiota bacterium]